MFWRSSGYSQPSAIEVILDKDEFTLEELLDEDDIIQECKSLNSRVVCYFKDVEVVKQLLRYLVEPSPEDADIRRKFKYPYVACEIFTCELDGVLSTLFESEEPLDILFSLLDLPAPLPTVLAGFFAKVTSSLLTRRTAACMHFLQGRQEILAKLVSHLGTTSIAEVVMKLVGADEQILMFSADALQWLGDTMLLELILDSLAPDSSSNAHSNAADVLTAIARTTPSALASQLASPMYLRRLFQHANCPGSTSQTLVLDVCMALLDPKRANLLSRTGFMDAQDCNSLMSLMSVVSQSHTALVECCLSQLEPFVTHLTTEGDEKEFNTSYGQLTPPLGSLRLKVVEFISVLTRVIVRSLPSSLEELHEEFVRVDALQRCITLFFEFPFNSLLHNHVEALLKAILESGHEPLLVHLIDRCELLNRLATAPTRVLPKNAKAELRAGYMGYVTRIGNKIKEIATRGGGGPLEAAIETNATWRDWVAGSLWEQNQLESGSSWACGRPSHMDDPCNDSSDNDDDLRADFGLGSMANKIGEVYHRYSGGEVAEDDDGEDGEDGALFEDGGDGLTSLDFPNSQGFVSLALRAMGGGEGGSDSSEDSDDDDGEGAAIAPANPFIDGDAEDEVLLVTSDDEVDHEIEAVLSIAPMATGATAVPLPIPICADEDEDDDEEDDDDDYDDEDSDDDSDGEYDDVGAVAPAPAPADVASPTELVIETESSAAENETDKASEDVEESGYVSIAPQGPEPMEQEEVMAEFNTFNYWKCSYMDNLVPDDI